MVKGQKPTVSVEPPDPERVFTRLTRDFDIFTGLARFVIAEGDECNYLAAVVHHLIFDAISGNHFVRAFLTALDGALPDAVDVEFLKLSAFHQQMKHTDEYAQVAAFAQSTLGNLGDVGFLVNPGKGGKPGLLRRELKVNPARLERLIAGTGVNRNILFTAILGCALSALTGKKQVLYGALDHGRDRLGQYDAIGLFINVLPIIAEVGEESVASFLKGLSDTYYQLLQYNFFPIGVLAQDLGIKPMVVFQYFPDWISEAKASGQLAVDDSIVNEYVSRMGDYISDALINLVQKGDRYTLQIFYSSYYTREIMENLAETYQKILTRVTVCDPEDELKKVTGQE